MQFVWFVQELLTQPKIPGFTQQYFQHSYQHGTLAQDTANRNRRIRAERRKNLEAERLHELGQARQANPPLNAHQRNHLGKLFPLIYLDWKHVRVADRV